MFLFKYIYKYDIDISVTNIYILYSNKTIII